MTFAPVAVHRALGARLAATPAVVAAVPAAHIVDAHALPQAFPMIQIGEGHVLRENLTLSRRHVRVLAKVDIWTANGATSRPRVIAGLVNEALRAPLELADGMRVLDQEVERMTFQRVAESDRGHAVVLLSVLVEEPIQ